jgi:thiol-disulfide isomerase/thioredoxin
MFLKDFYLYEYRILTKILVFSGIVLFLLFLPLSHSLAASPNVALEGLDGKQHKLSEYIGKGKWTAVNVWGTRCPPCREEMPELVMFHDEHVEKDATILGIAIDFPSYEYAKKHEVAEFVEDYLVSFPVLLSDSSITKRIGAGRLEGLPSTYMFTPDGDLVGYQVGSITRKVMENYIKRYESRQKAKEKSTAKAVDTTTK